MYQIRHYHRPVPIMNRRLILVKGARPQQQPTREERIAEEFQALRRRVKDLETLVLGWLTPDAAA